MYFFKMNILILIDQTTDPLKLFSKTLASSLAGNHSTRIVPAMDATVADWNRADCVLLGFTYSSAHPVIEIETFLASQSPENMVGKNIAIFQVQSHEDAPLSAAYGYGLTRRLGDQGVSLLGSPIVFFCDGAAAHDREGELMRVSQWTSRIVKGYIPPNLNSWRFARGN